MRTTFRFLHHLLFEQPRVAVPTKLKDRYEIRQVLGRGGMGVVYRAYDSVVKREVALKTLRDAPNRAALQLFYKECDVLASMSHPNIVEIFDIGEFEEEGASKPYFVMPLLPGISLDKLITTSSHRLTVERSVDIMTQACRGLHAAHERGLVHRDLKPSNLFVMEDDSVKIIDFGLAHIVDSHSSTGVKGTLLYMAPEQVQSKPLSAQTDIYALGVSAYETLARRLPWERGSMAEIAQAILHQNPPPVSEINPSVNQAISRVVHKSMAKQPWHRFSTAREFAEALQKALRNEPLEFFDPARIKPRVERAARAFEQGDYQFAIEILSELEAEGHIDPEMARLRRQIDQASQRKTILQLLQSARRRMEEEEYPLALQKIQEALQLEPDNAEALSLKNSIELGRSQRQVDEWLRLARQHLDNYGFSHARQALQNVLKQNSTDSQALELLAAVDRREQDYLRERQQKEQLYQEAMGAYHKGELSSALSKLQRVLELDRRAPDTSSRDSSAAYQNLYNQVRSEHDAISTGYSEARAILADRNFSKAFKICEEFLIKYPGHALFQALKFDVQEQQRQELSSYIADIDRQAEAEPDLERRVNILREAAGRYPDEPHFKRALQLARDKRDLVNSIVAKARQHEELGQFNEALAQWEILRTIYSQYPGLAFEVERVMKRRDLQSREEAKARWVQQVDGHLESGDYSRAASLLESALAEFPGDPELVEVEKVVRQALDVREQAQRLLAESQELCAQQKFEDGINALRRAHSMDLHNPVVRAVLLDTLAERARAVLETDWHSAEGFIGEALELDPGHPLARSLRTLIDDQRREEFVDQCVSRARQLQAAGDLEAALAQVEQGIASYPQAIRLAQLRATLKKAFSDSQESQLRQSQLASQREADTVAETAMLTGATAAGGTEFLTENLGAPAEREAVPEGPQPGAVVPPAPPPAAPPQGPATWPPAEPMTGQEVSAPSPEVELTAHKRPAELSVTLGAEKEPRRSPGKKIAIVGAFAAALLAAFLGYQQGWFDQRQPASQTSQPQQPPEPVSAVEETAPPPPAEQEVAVPTPEPSTSPPVRSEKTTPPMAAPRPPATSKEASISVGTNPSGATVVFDHNAETSCVSPCSLILSPGRHTASATLAGYRTALKIFHVPEEADLTLALARIFGHVQVLSSPTGANILVNGQQRSEATPATLNLPVGKYTVTVVKEGFRQHEQTVEVKDGAYLKLDFTLAK
jgi:serine/threonine-protein kinase